MSWAIERQEILGQIQSSDLIFTDITNTYKLTHYYDHEPRVFYVKSTIKPEIMEALIAYIQYEMSNVEMEYSMDQTEVIYILKEFYNAADSKRGKNMTHIDLYWNWEKWCGAARELQSVELFKRDGLKEKLKDMYSGDQKNEWLTNNK